MTDSSALQYGKHPGLRFACMLDGRGGCEDLGWAGIESWQPGQGVLWIHLERDEPIAQKWMRERSGIDPLIVEALLAEESRPRVEASEDGLLVVLRGVNVQEQGAPVGLVPIHLWVDAYRVISLRDKNHLLMALRDIREALTIGRGALGSGQLFALIAALLLPPSLFAGMLGMNIGGIPGSENPVAFVVFCILVAVVFPFELCLLRRLGWL